MNNDFDLISAFITILIGIFGGIAKFVNNSLDKFNLRLLISRLVVSAFTAFIVGLLLTATNIPENVRNALVGIAGYGGAGIMDALVETLKNKLNKDHDK